MRGTEKEKITIIFEDVNLPSFNTFYSQKLKPRQRSDTVWKWKLVFQSWIKQQLSEVHIEYLRNTAPLRVDVTIYYSHKSRWFDVDNCTMYGKLFLDTLKNMKLIKDDNPKIIKSISYTIELNAEKNKIVYEIYKM